MTRGHLERKLGAVHRKVSGNKQGVDSLTSDDKPDRLAGQSVLSVEIACCDLALPYTVVELNLGRPYPYGTVAQLLGTGPLVFVLVHPHWLKQYFFR